jgi:hypothetical protein
MPASAIFGLLGCALLCLGVAASAARLGSLGPRIRIAAALAAAVLLFVPLGDLSIAACVRGVTGDPSAATLALAATALLSWLTGRRLLEPREPHALLWLVAAGALFLYPFALGWTPFDPYALGYGSIAMVTALLVVALAAWRAGLRLVVIAVLAGSLAYLAGAYESRNLWDYLIDPLAALYAVARLSAGWVRRYSASAASARR